MREINLKEIKSIAFDLLKQIKNICDKENFRYTLIGGTLLGAVRHKGFIPWDDDIDIAMPRKDYNLFLDYCKNNDVPFNLFAHELNNKYNQIFAKACAKNTKIEDFSVCDNVNLGVFVDIFPIDGLGNTIEEAKLIRKKTIFMYNLLVAANWKKFEKSKTHAWYINPVKFVFFIISRFTDPQKLIKSIEKHYVDIDFDKSKYCGVVCGSYREREVFPTEIYNQYTELKFEEEIFSSILNYDKYLKQIYGHYMNLPPENRRVSHHSFKAYITE